jgi:hypothetical protein
LAENSAPLWHRLRVFRTWTKSFLGSTAISRILAKKQKALEGVSVEQSLVHFQNTGSIRENSLVTSGRFFKMQKSG